jgi:hypothetical protein
MPTPAPLAAEPEAEPAEPEEAAAPPPPLSLQLQFDPASGEVTLDLGGDAEPLRLVYEDGRWRVAPK